MTWSINDKEKWGQLKQWNNKVSQLGFPDEIIFVGINIKFLFLQLN